MRQRKIKDLNEKTALHSAYIVEEPASVKGRWQETFRHAAGIEAAEGHREIYLEIGCGKGRFITTLAERNPDRFYLAVEGAESVALRALEKAAEKGLSNILFITAYVNDLTELFEKGEIAGIYLNFSDPWPKDRHAKRRLTHARYLKGYREILMPGSLIEFKTDNDGLFAFSLGEFEANNMEIMEQTDDLHRSDCAAKEIETEYEHKFRLLGNRIHYCKVKV